MKKILMVVAMAMLAIGCGGEMTPAKSVEACWKLLSKGDVQKAVGLMDAKEGERALYVELFGEQCGKLQAAGGVKEFEITGTSEGAEDATVDAVVRLRDGQEIEASYQLIRREGKWLITE